MCIKIRFFKIDLALTVYFISLSVQLVIVYTLTALVAWSLLKKVLFYECE